MKRRFSGWVWTLLIACAVPLGWAGEVRVKVTDEAGTPLPGVGVVLSSEAAAASEPQVAVMDQIDEQFVPELLVIQVGSSVAFPNSDAVQHHVYSFSAAKTFELPLFHGRAYPPVLFDRPGLVVVGCNIHDHMVGYILVVDSPLTGVTGDDGVVAFSGVPVGAFQVGVYRAGTQGLRADAARGSLDGGAGVRPIDLSIELPGGAQPETSEALAWEDY